MRGRGSWASGGNIGRIGLFVVPVALLLASSGCFSSSGLNDGSGDGVAGGTEVEPEEKDDFGGNSSGLPFLDTCGPAYAPAIPATDVVGNEDSGFQFHQFRGSEGTGSVFISWRLHSMLESSNDWPFAVRAWDNEHEVELNFHTDQKSADCIYLGEANHEFPYFVEAGSGAWESPSDCVVTTHWGEEMGDRLGYTMKNRTTGEVYGTHDWRSGKCPVDDVWYVVESIIAAEGRASVCVTCTLPLG